MAMARSAAQSDIAQLVMRATNDARRRASTSLNTMGFFPLDYKVGRAGGTYRSGSTQMASLTMLLSIFCGTSTRCPFTM